MQKQLVILGSTGSIGTQTLDIVRQYPDRFSVYALTANTSVDLLVRQAREFRPAAVCIADESLYEQLCDALADTDIKVWAGSGSIEHVAQADEADIVVAAMVGFAGLKPTIAAIRAGKTIALANKETLVVAGAIIEELSVRHHAPIIPVDSEHSAIFQCLAGEELDSVEKILLTASGGPFRTFTEEQLRTVTAAQALQHPNWQMGAKITIDSATMMNKGFEVIEAKWLFGVRYDQIQVLVHPQSIVHSAVQFRDGAVKAQLGTPDMRLPILYALAYPERVQSELPRIDWLKTTSLTFEQADTNRFPCLGLAYDAIARGGNMPCILNAANEVANAAFRKETCSFAAIACIIEETMQKTNFIRVPSLDDLFATDLQARQIADCILKKQTQNIH